MFLNFTNGESLWTCLNCLGWTNLPADCCVEWLRGQLNPQLCSFVLFLSCSRFEGWPHRGRTFSIYLLYPLSFWLILPRGVMSMSWCCPSRPCVVFLAFMHLTLFLALSLSPSNFLVFSAMQSVTKILSPDAFCGRQNKPKSISAEVLSRTPIWELPRPYS